MNKLILISLLTITTLSISAEQETFKSCLSGERESSAKEANSFSCIESANSKLSAWCAKMAETNSSTKKYVSSSKSCRELGFIGKPSSMPLGFKVYFYRCFPLLNEMG